MFVFEGFAFLNECQPLVSIVTVTDRFSFGSSSFFGSVACIFSPQVVKPDNGLVVFAAFFGSLLDNCRGVFSDPSLPLMILHVHLVQQGRGFKADPFQIVFSAVFWVMGTPILPVIFVVDIPKLEGLSPGLKIIGREEGAFGDGRHQVVFDGIGDGVQQLFL